MSKKIYGVWASRKVDNEVYLGIDVVDEDEKKMFCAESVTFKEWQLFDTDSESNSMCVVSDEIATGLMDYLWKIGIRPTETGFKQTKEKAWKYDELSK